jgi:transcriptional regulator with XRE-family HTH domain
VNELPVANDSISLGTLFSNDSELGLSWDNAVRFQLSRQLVMLRKYRGWSQAKVARLAGTSQSHVARLESGEENFSADTAERFIVALEGRFDVSISPKEMHLPRWQPWWEMHAAGFYSATPLNLVAAQVGTDGICTALAGGWTNATNVNSLTAPARFQALPEASKVVENWKASERHAKEKTAKTT